MTQLQMFLHILHEGKVREPYSYAEVHECLINEGYRHYGWANGWKDTDIQAPKETYVIAYSNYSGSSTLYVNHELRIMYSVDMGD